MASDEREKIIQYILEQDKARFDAARGDLMPDWLNMDLTLPQLKITMLLYWRNRMRMSDLAEILQKKISTATGVVDRLVEHGLVQREEDPEDRRVVIVSITQEGRELCESLWQRSLNHRRAILDRLDEAELKIVAQAMVIFFKAMQLGGAEHHN